MVLSKIATMSLYCFSIILALAGCTTTPSGYFAAKSSTSALAISPPTATAIASDLVGQLSSEVGPGTGPVILRGEDTVMSRSLEDELRAHGFAVDPSSKSETAFALAYAITGQDRQIFVRMTSSTVEMTRIYAATEDGALSLTPLSILRRDEDAEEVQ